jgi:hypothetical protein
MDGSAATLHLSRGRIETRQGSELSPQVRILIWGLLYVAPNRAHVGWQERCASRGLVAGCRALVSDSRGVSGVGGLTAVGAGAVALVKQFADAIWG